jgi:hypothetical protein
MTDDVPQPSVQVRDHPAPLYELTDTFDRRNIAVGIDSSGQAVLVRPDSVLAAISKPDAREALAQYVARYDEEQAARIRKPREDERRLPFVTVRLQGVARERINDEERWTLTRVQQAMRELANLQPSISSEPNHVFLGAPAVKGNPLGSSATWAGELAFLGNVVKTKPDKSGVVRRVLLSTADPAEAPRFLRERLNLEDRRRPQVLVLDTGLRTTVENGTRRPEHRLLECCRVHATWRDAVRGPTGTIPIDDEDEPDDDGTGTLDFEGGHGTFIAGVLAQLCPDADVHTSGVLSSFGDGDVADVVAGLTAGLARAGTSIDIVVMSLGAFFTDDDPGIFGTTLLQLLGPRLGVAAAGNDATCRPYFPAALPDVIAVGAVSAAGPAWFTNFGGWVDACAPGVDVVSSFFSFNENLALFPELDDLKPREYGGWARWSGTSFSAPKVAALIAQEMYLNLDDAGTDLISAREAWRRLTTHNHLHMPDLGVVFNA